MLSGAEVVKALENEGVSQDPFIVVPDPLRDHLKQPSNASLELRLGRWLLVPRQTRAAMLDVVKADLDATGAYSGSRYQEQHMTRVYIPFGEPFYLHPGSFVLGSTLEWLRLPRWIGGYVTGKSSWGRRGLIIETAAGIHPCFTGCLTLEITNLGEVPIALYPGLIICQIFLHRVQIDELGEQQHHSAGDNYVHNVSHIGNRRPVLSEIKPDAVAKNLFRTGDKAAWS